MWSVSNISTTNKPGKWHEGARAHPPPPHKKKSIRKRNEIPLKTGSSDVSSSNKQNYGEFVIP